MYYLFLTLQEDEVLGKEDLPHSADSYEAPGQ